MNLFAWPLTGLALVFMLPWARWLVGSRRAGVSGDRVLVALTTLGLSTGTLSLVMLGIGMLGLRIDWRLAALLCAILGAAGLAMNLTLSPPPLHREGLSNRIPSPSPSPSLRRGEGDTGGEVHTSFHERTRLVILLIIGILVGLILFNAAYWPFGIDDAVTIYATFGKQIALTGQLPRGSLYETYPMLVPLNYAFIYQMAGWINEYLAALIPALLSVGVVGAAYVLGRELRDRTTGLVAALLIGLSPMFTHWASTGYVDLPAGFFFTMAAIFLLRLEKSHAWPDALLAGIMAGLSAWTKNSGLLIGPSIVLWLAWSLARGSRLKVGFIGLILTGFVLVAGPWYARNLALAGLIVPPTGWTWKAARTLSNLFPYLLDTRYFVTGWLLTAGLLFTIWQATWNRARPAIFMLIFYLPFFAVWWALVSYDGRFLLALTPFAAVMGACLVQAILPRLPRFRYAPLAGLILIALLALPAASAAVDYKLDLLHQPFMSDADKHRLRLGVDRYNMALYLRTLPMGSRIWTQDLLLPYQADGMQMTIGAWPDAGQLAAYDYWVLSPGETLPDWFSPPGPDHVEGGYRLYRLH